MARDFLAGDAAQSLFLLTPRQMAAADAAAMAGGMAGTTLMENAGWALANAAAARFRPCHVLVACGPGNNGGDGFVAARYLARWGWPVRLALLGEASRLKGDAAWAASLWEGPVAPLRPDGLDGAELVIDALFGAGLSRPLEGDARAFVEAVNARREADAVRVAAADLPSGVDGETGRILGATAVQADLTVTFFRKKPGHVLHPGRGLCGRTRVADIGIGAGALAGLDVKACENAPALWRDALPRLDARTHKYRRGHLLVITGSASHTGAARMAARAGLRLGAGLVTLGSPPGAILVNAAHETAIMLARVETAAHLQEEIAHRRITAMLIGPACGVTARTRELTLAALAGTGLPLLLDADALSVFGNDPEALFAAIAARDAPVVLTPHGGEFARLFPDLVRTCAGKLKCARAAARRSAAIVVLKGADTVIAAPDGEAVVNTNAPPWLATAGSGDVLAGAMASLLAQGMAAFPAASAATWIHGQAARQAGSGLIATDLPSLMAARRARLGPPDQARSVS